MPITIARVTPTDFDAWHEVHMRVIRERGAEVGMISEVIYRDRDDPRTLVIVQQVESIERVAAFLASAEMQRTIGEAPIEGPPTFWLLDEAEVIDDIASLSTA